MKAHQLRAVLARLKLPQRQFALRLRVSVTTGRFACEVIVEVRNRFDSVWSAGFTVVEATADGCRLRRNSDGAVLPCLFAWSTVRAASIG